MRRIVLLLPAAFLVLHLLQIPLPLPSFLLPRRVVMPADGRTDPRLVLEVLQSYPRVLLPVGDTVLSLRRAAPPAAEALGDLLGRAERAANLAESLLQARPLLPARCRVLAVLDRRPSAAELEQLCSLERKGLPPVELRLLEEPYDPLFLASSYTFSSQESSIGFDLLFSDRVREYQSLKLELDGRPLMSSTPAELAEGRRLHTSFALPEGGELDIRIALQGTAAAVERSLKLHCPGPEDPQVLLITDKAASRNFLDSLYRVKRASPAAAVRESLASYPLLVLDGIPLKSLGPQLTEAVSEIHERKAASLFFVSDSGSFGRKGDNPPIEAILPVELSPRSLRYVPDLGILILLDVSASMMGDKLSLAKVSALELLKNLKDSDRVSILAFWDRFRWLRGFEEKRSLSAEAELAPLIAQGGTDIHQALAEGLGRLIELDMEEKHVILISDGKTKEGDFPAQIRRAHSRGISISALAVGEEVNVELLSRIAQESGGRYYRVQSLEEIPSIIFEDRKQIARSSFARDLFTVFDSAGAQLGRISGMSLFTPKPGRAVVYRNQFDDPLLMVERRDRQVVMLFLSDLYGTYTGEFLLHPEVLPTFRALLDTVLRPHQITLRIAEAAGGASVTLSGEGLVEPRIELFGGNRMVAESPMQPGIFHTYQAEFPALSPGPFTMLLHSQGVPLARIPFYYNGLMEGIPADAVTALAGYRARPFVSFFPARLYLVLFFISSVAVTWLARGRLWSRPA